MALSKDLLLSNGVTVNYHRIAEAQKNQLGDKVDVFLDSYVSKDVRLYEEEMYQHLSEYNEAVMNGDEDKAQEIRDLYWGDLEKAKLISSQFHIIRRNYSIGISELHGDISFEAVYNYLQENVPDFEGATDI